MAVSLSVVHFLTLFGHVASLLLIVLCLVVVIFHLLASLFSLFASLCCFVYLCDHAPPLVLYLFKGQFVFICILFHFKSSKYYQQRLHMMDLIYEHVFTF